MKHNRLSCVADWIMRAALALIFMTAGYNKLFVLGPEKFAAAVNIPLLLSWCAILGELGSGIAILAGGMLKNKTGEWITRMSGALMVFIMVIAFALVKIKGFDKGFLPGLQGIYDMIAITAMSLYYTLLPGQSRN